MKDIFTVLQDLATQSGWHLLADILTLIVSFFGAFKVVWGLWLKLWGIWKQRKLMRDLHPFYTPGDIQRATQYYINTTFQNVAPAKDDEPGRPHAVAARNKILPFFPEEGFSAR